MPIWRLTFVNMLIVIFFIQSDTRFVRESILSLSRQKLPIWRTSRIRRLYVRLPKEQRSLRWLPHWQNSTRNVLDGMRGLLISSVCSLYRALASLNTATHISWRDARQSREWTATTALSTTCVRGLIPEASFLRQKERISSLNFLGHLSNNLVI